MFRVMYRPSSSCGRRDDGKSDLVSDRDSERRMRVELYSGKLISCKAAVSN
jgi:hypothetical protein